MKATGIVRRIDELGRVVIPKEIRRTQRIRQGDALEIFTAADGQVVFKKYSPLVELGELAGVYAEVLAKNLGRPVLVCDRESIVAATGTGKGQLLGRQISDAAARLLAMRGPYTAPETAARRITAFDKGETVLLCVCPIVVQGDVEGGVLLTGRPQDAAPDTETAMPNLCIVSKRYLAGGGLYGTVAVIGSNRMEYEHLIPVLNYFAIKLGQSMSGKKEEQT